MFQLITPLPKDFTVAVSGGVDSMAALSFFCQRKHKPSVAFFHHGTATSEIASEFVKKYCSDYELNLTAGFISSERPRGVSAEEHWRNERYKFLHGFPTPVITAHHLGDSIEQWIFSSLHGKPSLIPYRNQNVVRPFLATPKSELISWCERHKVPWVEDQSNLDLRYSRNRIRHKIVPEALLINQGLAKVIRKKILARKDAHDS